MDRVKFIKSKNENIFYMDFSNATNPTEIFQVIEDSIAYIRKQPYSSVVGLTNMENMFFNNDVKSKFTTFLKGNKPYMKKSAVYGMSGLARILFNGLMKITGRDVRSFENKADAIEFLTRN